MRPIYLIELVKGVRSRLERATARVRSIFDYLKYADWEPVHSEWKNITLDEYVAKAYEENWMVRMLSNRFEGPLQMTRPYLE